MTTYEHPIDLIFQYAWIGLCCAGVWHYTWAMVFCGRVITAPLEEL